MVGRNRFIFWATFIILKNGSLNDREESYVQHLQNVIHHFTHASLPQPLPAENPIPHKWQNTGGKEKEGENKHKKKMRSNVNTGFLSATWYGREHVAVQVIRCRFECYMKDIPNLVNMIANGAFHCTNNCTTTEHQRRET